MCPSCCLCASCLPPRRAQESTSHLSQVVQQLLAVETVSNLLTISYLIFLLKFAFSKRTSLYSVFLAVPNGFLKQLASKAVKVTAAEEAESDGELQGLSLGCARLL